MEEQTKKIGVSGGKVIIVALIVAIVFGGGAYVYATSKASKEKKDLNAQITKLQDKISNAQTALTTATTTTPSTSTSTTATTDETASWKTYTNDKYNFTLTFTDKWRGYKVYDWNKEGAGSLAGPTDLYKFCVSTTSTTWTDSIKGYACPVSIYIYPKATYSSLADPKQPDSSSYINNKLGEADGNVFVAQYWQDSPDDLRANGFDQTVTNVAKSFKFTK